MKCTPQNTMYSASGSRGGIASELERVAGHVGELDDLVALVVVTEHEHPVAERRLGGAGALDQLGIATAAGSVPGQSTPRSDCGSLPLPSKSSACDIAWGSVKVT